MKKVRITLRRGLAGKSYRVKDTAKSLGLKRRGITKEFKVDEAILGKLRVLRDFIDLEIVQG